ncbi:DUF6518 family protein [Luteimicrobium sp. DT211]|uniref:DUF6518 family protein n=1 Tax=Luteimicrobium sp. DT211 TaxID=3393412 RepID=UPI003CF4BE24
MPDHPLGRAAVVPVASLLLGGLTAYAQGFLPDALAPVANSAWAWTLLAAVLVAWARPGAGLAAVLGAVSLVFLVVGYAGASHLRGLTYDPTRFGAVGLVVGPLVGVAAAWLRSTGVRAALATALLAGVGIGEGVYGLTTVAETTGVGTWVAACVVALGLLAVMLARRLRGALPVAIATGGTVAVAAVFVLAYRALG